MNDGDKDDDNQSEDLNELSARLVHDVATPMAVVKTNVEFLARHLPALLDAYRAGPADEPSPRRISPEHLDAIDRAPGLIQEQCARVEEIIKAYWRAVNRPGASESSFEAPMITGRSTSLAPARILVVEDEPVHQQIATKVLSPDYQVDIASTAREALEKCKSKPYDLVLLDIGLPDLDGRQLTPQIRRTHVGDLCIIALSNMPVSQSELRQAGFDAQLEKPLKLEALKRYLHNVQAPPREENSK